MPCSDKHFIPILDEIYARPDPDDPKTARKRRHPGWGGRRPGAGAPKGNLNAFKHGRTSRRQTELLEIVMEIPGAREALTDLARRNRRQREKAEQGYGVMLTRLLEKVAELLHNQDDGQGQNNQEFLDFLNTATAQMRNILQKQSRHRRTTIKRPPRADT